MLNPIDGYPAPGIVSDESPEGVWMDETFDVSSGAGKTCSVVPYAVGTVTAPAQGWVIDRLELRQR